jgi:hypothetical protein
VVEVALVDKAIPEGIVTAQTTPVAVAVLVEQVEMQVLAAVVLVVVEHLLHRFLELLTPVVGVVEMAAEADRVVVPAAVVLAEMMTNSQREGMGTPEVVAVVAVLTLIKAV